jgi:hypothetical protein
VGAGRSLEAWFDLVADVPAGRWRLVADGIIIEPVDVDFELRWRRAGRDDVVLGAWSTRFEPLPEGNFDAQPYEATAEAGAITYQPGDQLIFRYTGTGTDLGMAYIPNGHGASHNGRIPFVDLPAR